jgi:hypothetical protein
MGPRGAIGQPGRAVLTVAAKPLVGGGPRHAQGLGGLDGGQPSSVMRWTSSSRPNWVRRALAWAMRVPSRLEASTTQADRGDPQLSTTLVGTTPRAATQRILGRRPRPRRPVSRLSAAIPHVASCRTTAPRTPTSLSRADAVRSKAADGFMKGADAWHARVRCVGAGSVGHAGRSAGRSHKTPSLAASSGRRRPAARPTTRPGQPLPGVVG